MSFRTRYVAFLSQLEKIAKDHDELTDTDVRERLHQVINYYFVWNKTTKSPFPQRFAMFSAKADKAVRKAVREFVADAIALAEQLGIAPGAERHAVLEDSTAKTRRGSSYDLFLGSSDKALPPRKPSPDKLYKYETSKRASSAKAPLDLSLLTLKIGGLEIPANYAPDYEMYEYRLPDDSMVGLKGDTVEAVRKMATEMLAEMIEESRQEAQSRHKPTRRKQRKTPSRKK